jgi:hypothetical protein
MTLSRQLNLCVCSMNVKSYILLNTLKATKSRNGNNTGYILPFLYWLIPRMQ